MGCRPTGRISCHDKPGVKPSYWSVGHQTTPNSWMLDRYVSPSPVARCVSRTLTVEQAPVLWKPEWDFGAIRDGACSSKLRPTNQSLKGSLHP